MKLDLLFVSVENECFIGSYSNDGRFINKHDSIHVQDVDIKVYKLTKYCNVEPISFTLSDLEMDEYCNRLPINLETWYDLYKSSKEYIDSSDYFGYGEVVDNYNNTFPLLRGNELTIFNRLRYSSRFVLLNCMKELGK